MTPIKRFLIYFLLPITAFTLPLVSDWLLGKETSGLIYLLIILGVLWFVSIPFLLRGRASALTLCIFLQGLNVILLLMTLAPNATNPGSGAIDWLYIVTNLLGLGISFYLMLRLDRTDIRVLMTA